MAVTNTTYRFLVEKLGGTDPATFVGNEGEVFYDPDASSPTIRLSDGSTAGGISVGGSGGSSVWSTSGSNIYYDSGNVGIGVDDPEVRLEIDGVLGFETFTVSGETKTNIRIGDNTTGASITTGYDNIFIGSNAGNASTTGRNNVFIGKNAGKGSFNALGGNVIIGPDAGTANIDYANIFIGDRAGRNAQFERWGIFIGQQAGESAYNSQQNIFIGQEAGKDATNGFRNFGLGNFTLSKINGGVENIALGAYSGNNTSTGNYNNFFGQFAGNDNTTGSYNTLFGSNAGYSNTVGNYNVFFGNYVGFSNTEGNNNSFFGNYAGFNNTTGNDNIFIGSYAGASTTASNKIIFGRGFNFNNRFDAPDTTKDTQLAIGVRTSSAPANYWIVGNENFNVGIGVDDPQVRLQLDGTLGFGDTNIKIGDNTTGANLTSGVNNIFMGVGAGNSVTTGSDNNFFGRDAGAYNTTGTHNNFFGVVAGTYNTGSHNNFFGQEAGTYNAGNYNNFFSVYAGYYNTTGSHNNFFGINAGAYNTTGSNNIFFGSHTGASTTASNKIIFGNGFDIENLFDSPDTTKDTQLAIGVRNSSAPANYWLVGNENFNVGIGVTDPTSKLTVGGDIKAGTTASEGVILTDANGVAWRLTINTDGTLTTSAV